MQMCERQTPQGFCIDENENPQDTVNTTVWETKEDMDVYNTSDRDFS